MRAFAVALLLLIGLLPACKSKEKAAEANVPPPPEWVSARPISGMYYIGVGVAQKTPGSNYQRTARDNALSDLAGEIKVNVNTNSLLYTLERDYKFEQEFRETIRVTSNLDLEDYEAVGAWEDATSYWVYYRLSKTEFAEKQRQKQVTAQELGMDFLAKAQSAEAGAQFASAADLYLRGLQAIEMYLGENNQVQYQGTSMLLDNELYGGLRGLLNDVRVNIENDLELNYHNRFKTTAEVRVASPKTDLPLEGVPLIYEFFGSYGRYKGSLATNADGRAKIPINEADRGKNSNNLIVSIDMDQIFQPFQSDQFMRRLAQSFRGASSQKPIVNRPPSVHLIAIEQNLGKLLVGNPLSAAIMTSLGRRGVQFVNALAEADLVMTIDANTRTGGESQGFSTSLLSLNINLVDNKTKQNVYKVNRNDVKGVDLDFDRAGLKAYQNYTKNIESELMRKLVSDMF